MPTLNGPQWNAHVNRRRLELDRAIREAAAALAATAPGSDSHYTQSAWCRVLDDERAAFEAAVVESELAG